MRTSFIATVLNEEETIDRFLESILNQSQVPDEVIITDGGSTDSTVHKIKAFQKNHVLPLLLIQKKGNRSIGRNAAIEKAKNDIILCSDAGCILDRHWVKNISKPFADTSTDVAAGYYKGVVESVFQKCLIPYVLVMPDKVNAATFLPATRSMAFRKKVWRNIGMFPIKYSHNEDYVFSKALQKEKRKIVFVKSAIVYWYPPAHWNGAFMMFYRFAKGDSEAQIFRPKVVVLFIRYLICICLLISFFIVHMFFILYILIFLFLLYIVWAMQKNYKYVLDPKGFLYLIGLQFLADSAVLYGTLSGLLHTKK